jgi:type IV pilus assembly protein PilQ
MGPPRSRVSGTLLAGFLLLSAPLHGVAAEADAEARVSLDVRESDVTDIVRVLSEVAGFQVVFDPGLSCRLTLKLHEVSWRTALDVSLKSCGLGREEEGGILRIAPTSRLIEEAEAERRLREARAAAAPHRVLTFRLSYARAQEMAPIVKKLLAPRGDVVYDARTNTLMVID